LAETALHNTTTSWSSDFKEITKMRLAISVVFSSVAGYFLGATVLDFVDVLLLAIGGYLMVGASNAYNQVIEKDLDALMDRTKNRPLPAKRMSVQMALFYSLLVIK
jgi:protoheme IX farnesyltransferase